MENVLDAIIKELDNLFASTTSEADRADEIHSIPAFKLLQLKS